MNSKSSTSDNNHAEGSRTRTAFRLIAVVLGAVFIGVGAIKLSVDSDGWLDLGLTALMAISGLQLIYMAITDRGVSPLAMFVPPGEVSNRVRFLVADSNSQLSSSNDRGIADEERNAHYKDCGANPYAPPETTIPDAASWQSRLWSLPSPPHSLMQRFLSGSPFIHYGIVYFVDRSDEQKIHAAIPIAQESVESADSYADEAARVLPDFLASLPELDGQIGELQLVVRMIYSYSDLDHEVCERISRSLSANNLNR